MEKKGDPLMVNKYDKSVGKKEKWHKKKKS